MLLLLLSLLLLPGRLLDFFLFFITSELVVDWIYDLTCARAVGVIPPYVSECC